MAKKVPDGVVAPEAVNTEDEALKTAVRAWIQAKMDKTPAKNKPKSLPGWLSVLTGPMTVIFQAVLEELLKKILPK